MFSCFHIYVCLTMHINANFRISIRRTQYVLSTVSVQPLLCQFRFLLQFVLLFIHYFLELLDKLISVNETSRRKKDICLFNDLSF